MTKEELKQSAGDINRALGWGDHRPDAALKPLDKPAPPLKPDVVNLRPNAAQKALAEYEAALAKYQIDQQAYIENILARPQGSWTPDEQQTVSGALRQFLKGEQ